MNRDSSVCLLCGLQLYSQVLPRQDQFRSKSVCVCVCACVRACVRACVCACVRACVRV